MKLCDFGFARTLEGPGARYTDYVSTRWYRAPELLVGDREYGKGVDIWSVGCMAAEIFNGLPLFPGDSDIDQLYHIAKCFGQLPSSLTEMFQRNPMFRNIQIPHIEESHLQTLDMRFKDTIPKDALDFIKMCLQYDPSKRATCEQLLQSPIFNSVRDWYETELQQIIEKDRINLISISNGLQGSNNKRRCRKERHKRDRRFETDADNRKGSGRKRLATNLRPKSDPASIKHDFIINNSNDDCNPSSDAMKNQGIASSTFNFDINSNSEQGFNKDILPNIRIHPAQKGIQLIQTGVARSDVHIPPINIPSMDQVCSVSTNQTSQTTYLPNLIDSQSRNKGKQYVHAIKKNHFNRLPLMI